MPKKKPIIATRIVFAINNDNEQIGKLLEAIAEAIRTKKAESLLRSFAPDAVTFDLAPPLKPMGADQEGLEAWFDTWDGPIQYEITDLHITAGNDLAFARSINRIGGTKTDGKATSVWVRAQKRDGKWKVVHAHSSVPFYMDGSFRAAVDLKPY